MAIARVFKSGNSQAVRLPKKFHAKRKELEIEKRGNEIILGEAGWDGTSVLSSDGTRESRRA